MRSGEQQQRIAIAKEGGSDASLPPPRRDGRRGSVGCVRGPEQGLLLLLKWLKLLLRRQRVRVRIALSLDCWFVLEVLGFHFFLDSDPESESLKV